MVATEPPPAHQPGERSLDHPSSGKGTEARWKELVPLRLLSFGHEQPPLGDREGFDRLHHPAQRQTHPDAEAAPIVTISPQQLYPGKSLFEWLKQDPASLLVGAMRASHFDGQYMALSINEQVAFASPDFFSPYQSPSRDRERRWF